ncbi:putative membrane protein YccC [Azospirillum fermentarium]|uniref:FUSC family protein n=1 Tax=Azospirillum fermentarium TaxID=1233114 RepID=UPI002227D015|nr:FUSC family protein [Azospirillum fermentarium]MCW2248405.1 putative membrane protein YccC [Azospirillum fermentarium]
MAAILSTLRAGLRGFEGPRLSFTLRTAFASWLALALATALGLESPHWAAMTVWVVAQPTRGMLVEKSLYRLTGTFAGSVVGVGLVLGSGGNPWLLTGGLALWVALCAGAGNLLRHFQTYGLLLAGYTAAMVALMDVPHPDHVLGLAAGRVVTVAIGIAASALVSWLFLPPAAEPLLMDRLRGAAGDALAWSATVLTGAGGREVAERERAILSELAAVDDLLDAHASGSPAGYRRIRGARRLAAAVLALMAATRAGGKGAGPLPETAAVRTALAALTAGEGIEALPSVAIRLHRDWGGAAAASVRALAAVLAAGALWVATGWEAGPYLMLGTAVMASLFSSFDDPVRVLRLVLMGSAAGAVAAVVCRLAVLPVDPGPLEALVLTAPFLALGAVAMAHPVTRMPSLDYAMAFLLLAHPTAPLHGGVEELLHGAAAMLLGIGLALVSFRVVLPVNAAVRLRTVVAMTVRDLESLAASQAAESPRRWRARLYHRTLRLVRRADLVEGRDTAAIDGALAAFSVGEAILSARRVVDRVDTPAPVRRRLALALRRLQSLSLKPAAAADSLDRAAVRVDGPEAAILLAGARALRGNAAFFATRRLV